MNTRECFESLQAGFRQWESLFANQRFCVSEQSITWYDFRDPRLSAVLDADEFSRAVEQGQYSFQLIDDGSLVRIGYTFDRRGRKLKEASLAYVQAPSDEILCRRWGSDVNSEGYFGHCHWLRVDYDPENASGPMHPACHLHLSSLPTTRIPLSRLPTPKQFIGWVVSIVSPALIEELIETPAHAALNAPCFVDHWEADLAQFFFLAVPPSDAQGQLAALRTK